LAVHGSRLAVFFVFYLSPIRRFTPSPIRSGLDKPYFLAMFLGLAPVAP